MAAAGWSRRTKIVATLGPATDSPKAIAALVAAGVDVVRLNMSHGVHGEHARRARMARTAAARAGRPVAVLLDLCGPKLRTAEIDPGEPPVLTAGNRVVLCAGDAKATAERIPISEPRLLHDVRAGERVLIDDGRIELAIESAGRAEARCVVVTGGPLKSRAGLNLPDSRLSIESLTQKDRRDLAFGLALGVDLVALSFVRRPEDMTELRALVRRLRGRALLVAKIEKPEALERLEAIVSASDGVMVARGDLGVEMPPEEVPPAQKRILASASDHGRLSITATQMLESMVTAARPTRAEASDVANAVFDGTDAVMLSEETAVGKDPARAVAAMAAIASRAEQSPYARVIPAPALAGDRARHAVVHAATVAARDVDARALLVFSRSGQTAILASKMRPSVPVIAVSPEARAVRTLALAWGVRPVQAPYRQRTEELLRVGERALARAGLAARGDTVVAVFGRALASGTEYAMKIHPLS